MFDFDSKVLLKDSDRASQEKQVEIALRTHPFVMRENYLENHRKVIYMLVLNFFKLYLGSSDTLLSADGLSNNNSF